MIAPSGIEAISISLSFGWYAGHQLDFAIQQAQVGSVPWRPVVVRINEASFFVSACVRLLCWCNQRAAAGMETALEFVEPAKPSSPISWLSRIGFFDHLDPRIQVLPQRPIVSSAAMYHGTNDALVEIAAIDPKSRDRTLPARLSQSISKAASTTEGQRSLDSATFTVLAELIDNIYTHSSSTLPGYAVLQTYPRRGTVEVVVADNGAGILKTLRPALVHRSPRDAGLSDLELLLRTISVGLSRHDGCGCGLKRSFDCAAKFQADLEIRVPECSLRLTPDRAGYRSIGSTDPATLAGTHLCFDFRIDRTR